MQIFGLNLVKLVNPNTVDSPLITVPMITSDSEIKRYKDSLEYKKWKIARFFTLYCDSPTNPEDIKEETVIDFEKIFNASESTEDVI